MAFLQPAYLARMSFGAADLAAIHRLGEARGRQDLFLRQYPEQLNTLRTHAQVESIESSNRIEGIVAAPGRVRELVVHQTQPRDRSEQEIAGYRDALQLIHESYADMRLTQNVVLQLHQMLYRYQAGTGGRWKSTNNDIVERDGTGQVVRVRFTPTSAVATPQAMADLVTHYQSALDQRLAEPLVLLPLAVLDFLCVLVAVAQAASHLDAGAERHRRIDAYSEDEPHLLVGHQVAQPRAQAAGPRLEGQVVQQGHAHAGAAHHLERDVARHHVERLAQFTGEDVGNLPRRLDVVEVPAALRGQAREQLFVEVGADAEGGGGDALGAQPRGRGRQRLRVDLACVGEAVGEQQHAFHARARCICDL